MKRSKNENVKKTPPLGFWDWAVKKVTELIRGRINRLHVVCVWARSSTSSCHGIPVSRLLPWRRCSSSWGTIRTVSEKHLKRQGRADMMIPTRVQWSRVTIDNLPSRGARPILLRRSILFSYPRPRTLNTSVNVSQHHIYFMKMLKRYTSATVSSNNSVVDAINSVQLIDVYIGLACSIAIRHLCQFDLRCSTRSWFAASYYTTRCACRTNSHVKMQVKTLKKKSETVKNETVKKNRNRKKPKPLRKRNR